MSTHLSLAKGYSGPRVGMVRETEKHKGSAYGHVEPVVNSDFQESKKASLNSNIFATFPEIQFFFFSLGAVKKNAYKFRGANESFTFYIN